MNISQNSSLLFELLETSKIFNEQAKIIVRRAVETGVLPDIDEESLLFVLKMEKNCHALIDQRAKNILNDLKKKYHQEI